MTTKIMLRALLGFSLLFKPWNISSGERDLLVIWNVGQGSWATAISSESCDHFDLGGERNRWPNPVKRCFGVMNRLYLSHLDWDHISNIKNFRRKARTLCLSQLPVDFDLPKTNLRKKALVTSLPKCDLVKNIREIGSLRQSREPNALSRVYVFKKFIFPGDSTTAAEKVWAKNLPKSAQAEILVLGHHGSRTSTSELLLQQLKGLRTAVASARRRKYGHPHKEVALRLHQRNLTLLITEKWGHIYFEL